MLVAIVCGRFYPATEYVALDSLPAFRRQIIIEKLGLYGITLHEIEFQVEIIIKSVGRHGGVSPWKRFAVFIHLESGSEELRFPDHGDWNVSDENHAGKILLGVPFANRVSHRLRRSPCVMSHE